MEMAVSLDQRSIPNGAPVESVTLGQTNKEGTFSFNPGLSSAAQEVREFLSIADGSTAVEQLGRFRSASDQFYRETGTNPVLPTYGQVGEYEPIYKSYKYDGFTYRQDSLRRLGIANIELKDGQWQPERNAAYRDVYEVTYP